MTTNGNGHRRKLNITKWLSTLGMIMLFAVLVFCVWSMAGGKNNEEILGSIALRCTLGIIGLALAFHGKELVREITGLVLAFKGITSGIIDKVKNCEHNEPEDPAGTEIT